MQLQEIIQRDDSVFPSGILKNQITTGILTPMQSRHRTFQSPRGLPRLSFHSPHSLLNPRKPQPWFLFARVHSVKSMQSRGRCLLGLTFFAQQNSPGIPPGGAQGGRPGSWVWLRVSGSLVQSLYVVGMGRPKLMLAQVKAVVCLRCCVVKPCWTSLLKCDCFLKAMSWGQMWLGTRSWISVWVSRAPCTETLRNTTFLR